MNMFNGLININSNFAHLEREAGVHYSYKKFYNFQQKKKWIIVVD